MKINFHEIDKNGNHLMRLTGDDQEHRIKLMSASEDMYEACKEVVKAYKCTPTSMQPLFWLRCVQVVNKVEKE